MPSTTALVIASGPSREQALQRAIDSAHGLCDGPVVVAWSGNPDSTPKNIEDVTFLPNTGIRKLFEVTAAVAKDAGFAMWMNDDEHVIPTSTPMPYPITADLEQLGLRGIWVVVDRQGVGHGEPRFISAAFEFPFFSRFSLCGVGEAHTGRVFIVGAFHIEQVREPCPPNALRLNIGCGSRTFSRWTNIDYDAECKPDVLLDVSKEKLPFKDETVDAIYSSHMIDHLTYRDGKAFLEECRRVMTPGAPLRITSCDMEAFVRSYFAGNLGQFDYFQPEEFQNAQTQATKLGILTCGNASDRGFYSGHKMLYMADSLGELLTVVGFKDVRVCAQNEQVSAFDDVDDVFPDSSVIVEAVRP